MKKGFSLVELIISIFLLGIIVIFLYSTVSNLQRTNTIFQQKEEQLNKKDNLLSLLYDDIFQADDLNISGKHNTLINLETTNTIFDIEHPYVTWFVSHTKNTLLRFESIIPFNDMTIDNTYYYHISKISENCEVFHIYQSKKKEKILIHIKFRNKEPIIYEFPKPLNNKKITKKLKSSKKVKKNPHTL